MRFFVFLSGPDAKKYQDRNHTFTLVSQIGRLLAKTWMCETHMFLVDYILEHVIFQEWFGAGSHLNVPMRWGSYLEGWSSQSLTYHFRQQAGYALMTVCFVGMYMRARHFASRSWAQGRRAYVPTIECVLVFYCSILCACISYIWSIATSTFVYIMRVFFQKNIGYIIRFF